MSYGAHKVLCIIQARVGSTRLPGKTLMVVRSKTLLEHCVSRVRQARKINKIIVASTTNPEDGAIETECRKLGIDCFRGSVNAVLGRYYHAAAMYPEYPTIVRVTGDCPLIDPVVIDQVITRFESGEFDYVSNVLEETFPDGMDVEVFSRKALEISHREAKLTSEREHVTLYIRNQAKFKKGNVASPVNLSQFRLTVDEPADLEVVKFVIENSDPKADYQDYVELLLQRPEVFAKNSTVERNKGLAKSLREDKSIDKNE